MADLDMDPEIADVLAANQHFYDPHEGRDLGATADLWEHSDRAVCIHPGWSTTGGCCSCVTARR